MENNIIQHPTGTIIINGGNPLEGCPKDWDEAKLIQKQLNEHKDEDEPQWSFDCGFKLDFDGSIVTIGSRFYPPKTHYGATRFDCSALDELKKEVEAYVKTVVGGIEAALK
jgi:hypothetical protein